MRTSFTGVFAALVFLCSFTPLVTAVPDGFVDEEVARIDSAGGGTGFNFAPKPGGGHMMLVCAKNGLLYVLPDPDNSDERKLILDISEVMCSNKARGLQSVAVSPDFLNDRYVYVFYTLNKHNNCGDSPVEGPVNRLSRFIMEDDLVLDRESETVLLETSSLLIGTRNGGDMNFAKDGYLYATIGDGGDRQSGAPQDLSKLLGSVIRIDKDGGIPPDNPFTSRYGYNSDRCNINGVTAADKVCEEIYAYGFRQPFRFGFDPNTPDGVVRAMVNDVGGSVWEEMSELKRGGNHGWPEREGPCDFGSITNCDDPGDDWVDPTHFYVHTPIGGAAVGLAFVPNGLWPPEYDNSLIFADYAFDKMFHLTKDESRLCRSCVPPVSGWKNETFHNYVRIVQVTFGPYKNTQALYYTAREGGNTNHVRRIYFDGGVNRSPDVELSVDHPEVLPGEPIIFDGSKTTDPDGDLLTFEWNFDDGNSSFVGPAIVTHQYLQPGEYNVRLMVKDPNGLTDIAWTTIKVGARPIPTMISPPEGATFAVGDIFTLSGSAVDGAGNPLPDTALMWEVRQHHNTHFHPFLDQTVGNNIVLDGAPEPEDFEASTNSHLEVILTATDSNGVSKSLSRLIQPKLVLLDFDTEPSGLELDLDDFQVRTPIRVTSWENHNLTMEALHQSPWFWISWSNNLGQRQEYNVPAAVPGIIPRFVATYVMAKDAPSATPSAAPTEENYTEAPSAAPTALRTSRPTATPTSAPTAPRPTGTAGGSPSGSDTLNGPNEISPLTSPGGDGGMSSLTLAFVIAGAVVCGMAVVLLVLNRRRFSAGLCGSQNTGGFPKSSDDGAGGLAALEDQDDEDEACNYHSGDIVQAVAVEQALSLSSDGKEVVTSSQLPKRKYSFRDTGEF